MYSVVLVPSSHVSCSSRSATKLRTRPRCSPTGLDSNFLPPPPPACCAAWAFSRAASTAAFAEVTAAAAAGAGAATMPPAIAPALPGCGSGRTCPGAAAAAGAWKPGAMGFWNWSNPPGAGCATGAVAPPAFFGIAAYEATSQTSEPEVWLPRDEARAAPLRLRSSLTLGAPAGLAVGNTSVT